jgi:hypothetical protein
VNGIAAMPAMAAAQIALFSFFIPDFLIGLISMQRRQHA